MNDILKPGLVLLVITMVAAACLGFVFSATKDEIASKELQTKNDAMAKLVPGADFKEEIEIPADSPVSMANTGYVNGEVAGYVLGVAPRGYDGEVQMLVGINPDGTIIGIDIVKQTETPGLGGNAELPEFKQQYVGKSGQLTVTKSGNPGENEIQALTSATITTNAVTLGVNQALAFYAEHIQ